MAKYDEMEERIVRHTCVFGVPQTGKSSLVSHLARAGFNLLWISLDNHHMDIIGKLTREERERVEIIAIADTKDYPIAALTCMKLITGKPFQVCDEHGQIDCSTCRSFKEQKKWTRVELSKTPLNTIVVFDHISQLADSCMNFVILKAIRDGDKDATGAKEQDPDAFKPGFDQYRYQGTLMNKFLTNIQQAPYNVACIAHVCETEMDDGRKLYVPLIGTIPFSRNSAKYFDDIIYCEVGNRKHKFGSATTYALSILTGSKKDIKIELQEQPTLLPFFEESLSAYKKQQSKQQEREESNVVTLALPTVTNSIDTSSNVTSSSSKKQVVEEVKEVKDEVKIEEQKTEKESERVRIAAMLERLKRKK